MEKFLHDYSLSEEEKYILSQKPIFENGSDEFFVTLNRASKIKERCSALMQDPYCMMTATLELLETVSSEEEKAYQRLFNWCQNECKLSGDKKYCLDGGNQSFLRLREGLQVLSVKESYFNHCITEFVNNRRNILMILLAENVSQWRQQHSDDHPNQAISGVFTWLHEYMNEERSGIRLLFMKELDDRIGGSSEKEENHMVVSCMDVIFSGANRYIQDFLMSFIDECANLPQLFETMQILSFYENIVSLTISGECSLNSTIHSIEQSLWTRITSLLTLRVKHYFKLSPFVGTSFINNSNDSQNPSTKTNSVFTELLLLLRECFDMFWA